MRGNIPDERQGILDYRNGSDITPRTERGNFSIACRDEPYCNLVPHHAWYIELNHRNKDFLHRQPFEVGMDAPQPPKGRPNSSDLFVRWSMGMDPMFLNFSDPTINNLHKNATKFAAEKVVIPENYTAGAWVYMIITGDIAKGEQQHVNRKFVPGAHPVSQITTTPPPPPSTQNPNFWN